MTLRGRSGGGFVAALCRLLHAVLSGGLFVLISSVCRRAFAEETGALCSPAQTGRGPAGGQGGRGHGRMPSIHILSLISSRRNPLLFKGKGALKVFYQWEGPAAASFFGL